MAEKKIDMQIGLGVEYDATGIDEANADLEQLLETKEELVTRTNEVTAADAKEQKAMKLATKSRNELIKTLKQLQRELKAAAEAQDVEKYRAVEQEIAETRSAFEKQNQVLELNNIQLGQQAQNGMMVANTLTGMANGMKDGTLSAGDFVSGILSISAAMKAGLGPIGWLMMAVQGLQAAWDFFSAENKKEEEVRAKRAEDMQRLAEITDNARTALEEYNRTELSKKALAAVQGYYADINSELERQIKNIERATQAELARLAITQDEEEHKRTMKRAKLGRQLAAGTITQEEYDRAIYDMNEEATKQGLDDDVTEAERQEKELTEKTNVALEAYEKTKKIHDSLFSRRRKYGKELTEGRLKILQDKFEDTSAEVDEAVVEWKKLKNEGANKKLIAAAEARVKAAQGAARDDAEAIWQAYDKVHGEGAFASSGYTTDEAIAAMVTDRKDLDEQYTTSKAEQDKLWDKASGLITERDAARMNVKNARDRRTQELGQLADERAEEEKGRALQKLLDEKQKAAEELAKLETAELKRRRKQAEKRAKEATAAGDAEGAKVLEDLANLYKEEGVARRGAEKNKAAVDAASKKAETAGPTQDKRTDEVMREAQQLANRIAKGEALDGRSAEQLLALWKQAQATKDKKDDAFVAQLIALMQMQADVGAGLQAEVRKLKRKTQKLTNRNFD